MSYVKMEQICKRFGSFTASDHISFEVGKGSLTALLGPSGSGKTTILRMLAGLEQPSEGDIYIDGRRVNDLHPRERGVGFVFQNYALFRYMTVFDNIAFGLKVQKLPNAAVKKRVEELLELTELTGFERRYPNQLSGGQRQRVAFARALAPRPSLLLLDEPFAAVDARVRSELRIWLRGMIHKVGITSIFVTHDQDEAVEVADQIIVMNKGRIEQTGTPAEIYKHPATSFVAGFIGQGTVIADFSRLKGFGDIKGEYASAIVRPEFVEAFKPDNTFFSDVMNCAEQGIITDIRFRGNYLEVKLDVDGMTFITHRSPERRKVSVGERMNVVIYRILAFDSRNAVLVKNEAIASSDAGRKHIEQSLYGEHTIPQYTIPGIVEKRGY